MVGEVAKNVISNLKHILNDGKVESKKAKLR